MNSHNHVQHERHSGQANNSYDGFRSKAKSKEAHVRKHPPEDETGSESILGSKGDVEGKIDEGVE